MLTLNIEGLTRFVSAITNLIVDPKNSLVRSEYGKITSKNGISSIELYIVSTIFVVVTVTLMGTGSLELKTAFSMALYMIARIAYVSLLLFIIFYIFNKLNKKIAFEYTQLFLISTSVWSVPLVIMMAIILRTNGLSVEESCQFMLNKSENVSKAQVGIIPVLFLSFFAFMGYVYFFKYSISLGYKFSKSLIPFFIATFIVYPLLRPYVVVPMEALICGAP